MSEEYKPTKKEIDRHAKWQKHITLHYYHRRDWEASDDCKIWEDGGIPPKVKCKPEIIDIFGT